MITLDLNPMLGTYTWVYPNDPAVEKPTYPAETEDGSPHPKAGQVDEKAFEDLVERCLDGTAAMPTKSGQEPTRWEFRHLTEREIREMQRQLMESPPGGAYYGVALALVAAIQPDGRHEMERQKDGRGFVRVTDEYMDALGRVDHGQLINEMFARVHRSCRPSKNS